MTHNYINVTVKSTDRYYRKREVVVIKCNKEKVLDILCSTIESCIIDSIDNQ